MGALQSSGSKITILLVSSEFLEFLDPPVSKIGLSDFVGLGPTEQTVASCIGQKSDHLVFLEN
jgi:hypothetical protein